MKTQLFYIRHRCLSPTTSSMGHLTFLNFWTHSFQIQQKLKTIWDLSRPNIDGFYSTIAHLKAFIPTIPKKVLDSFYRIRERRETRKRKRAKVPFSARFKD